MSLDLEAMGQLSLLEEGCWRSIISVELDHRLVILCKSIPWMELMEKSRPILYDEQGIPWDTGGRKLNLRAHLGAYILQSVHGWTDRWTEEMVRFYFPARIFCGYLDSTGSLDHTKIEEFRNRFGEKGAELITHDMLKIARQFGFTQPDDVDMDTTVQEAGITHPTEMRLMGRLMRMAATIHKKLKRTGQCGLKAIRAITKKFKSIERDYRFFAKTKEKKDKIVRSAVALSGQVLSGLSSLVPGTRAFEALLPHVQHDVLKLTDLGPKLLDQILYWLNTGTVAADKIVSLWKIVPTAIKKGKLGKPVEFGRKWIINCYRGGYVLVTAPDNAKISDQHSVIESLSLHATVFDKMPISYGTDRGMWGKPNLELCLSAGIKKIAIQPKGRAQALVGQRDLRIMSRRRIGIEARIAHLKTRGLGRSRMRTDIGDLISGHRSALARNLTLLMKDLALQPALATLEKQ
jgi:transposase, IS5 family